MRGFPLSFSNVKSWRFNLKLELCQMVVAML